MTKGQASGASCHPSIIGLQVVQSVYLEAVWKCTYILSDHARALRGLDLPSGTNLQASSGASVLRIFVSPPGTLGCVASGIRYTRLSGIPLPGENHERGLFFSTTKMFSDNT